MRVSLISITSDAERVMGYCARVSNPANQSNENVAGLLRYCAKNSHWSVFETAHMCIEVETSMSIGEQLLRHRSFAFQKFSYRYATNDQLGGPACEYSSARRQAAKNRQASDGPAPRLTRIAWALMQRVVWHLSYRLYRVSLRLGVSREQARFLLPAMTRTRFYMTGSIRSWIHYLDVRTDEHTQHEHRAVAEHIKAIFIEQLPITAAALNWK